MTHRGPFQPLTFCDSVKATLDVREQQERMEVCLGVDNEPAETHTG